MRDSNARLARLEKQVFELTLMTVKLATALHAHVERQSTYARWPKFDASRAN